MVVPFSGRCDTLGASSGASSAKVVLFEIFVEFF